MAHRDPRKNRVLVVAAGLFLGLLALWARIAWIEVVQHRHYVERAELNQETRVLLKPVRGQLLDRRGRPLARDLVTYTISAAPREMKSPRKTARDLARVLDLNAATLERRFAARPQYLYVARRVAPVIGQRIAAWRRRGVYVSHETRREYTLGAAAQEILGRANLDNSGVEGLELQLDEELRGRPGWATLFRDGRGRTHALHRGMRRSPENGRHAVLTLDADLQAIVEGHLRRAIDTLRAERAFALFLDPRTGEILASVNVPHLPPGKAKNWNFTDQFEPGSTFKPVVMAAALEDGIAEPDDWFEASEIGRAQVAPRTWFEDVHKEAGFTLRDAMRWSSNIVMGKLAARVGEERLYRYATEMGFGSITGLAFPGEAGGLLRSPARWSLRSCPTIAIGHELSVTPLQLALGYAAIANGGVLMQPMLVREIREPDGTVVQRFGPHPARRVLSESTTRVLREMLASVVDSGTARAARVPGLSLAGKTGTAQKYDARVRTYGRGMYLSSFAGFVPADEPRLVGVVVIDEPRGKHYYGGDVAAPVFREVLLDLRRLPNGPLEDGITEIAVRPPALAPVQVPDLRLLQRASVAPRLAAFGLRARFRGAGERVLAQDPPAGRAIERGTSVVVWLAPPADSAARLLPDLTGLAVREALRRLGALAVRARVEGSGIVTRQDPPAGAALPLRGDCRLWCRPMPRAVAATLAPLARNGEP